MFWPTPKFLFSCFLLFLGVTALVACATYPKEVADGLEWLRQGQYQQAVEFFKHRLEQGKEKDRFLHLLEYATALQFAENWKESARWFNQADRWAEENDYISVTQTVASLALNEEQQIYKGESYERIMLNALNALNYLSLNDWEGAMVEVRKIDQKTKKFRQELRDNYEYNHFALLLSGLLYEAQKDWDEAYIAYFRSLELVEHGSSFAEEALWRMAERAGRQEVLLKSKLASRYRGREHVFRHLSAQDSWPKGGKAIVHIIYLDAWVAEKIPDPLAPDYPTLKKRSPRLRPLLVRARGEKTTATRVVYDLDAAFLRALMEDRNALIAKRLGAFVTKEILAEQVRQKNELLGFFTRLLLHFSERADLRYWSTLPRSVQIASIELPPGLQELEFLDDALANEFVLHRKRMQLEAGKAYFIVYRRP